MAHTSLINEAQLMTLVGSGGTEIPRSRRRVRLGQYGGCRHQSAESLGSTIVETRVEWFNESNSTWEVLSPWTAGAGADELVVSTDDQFPSAAASQEDVLVRAVCRGNGLLSPLIRFVELELRP